MDEPFVDYSTLKRLAHVYLEDSWVRDVAVRPEGVFFNLDLILTESHPAYRGPAMGEQYDYQAATLAFRDVTRIAWELPTGPPATDASGERDWGNIDYLLVDGETYRLGGDWGAMEITAGAAPKVLFSGSGANE